MTGSAWRVASKVVLDSSQRNADQRREAVLVELADRAQGLDANH
jgi:hypothetical protein